MTGTKEAKAKLQDDLLDLIAKFEEEYDVHVADISLYKTYRIGGRQAYTTAVELVVVV